MSVCIDSGTVLANTVGTTSSSHPVEATITTQAPIRTTITEQQELQVTAPKNIAKIVIPPNTSNTNTVLQKVVNPSLITVLNSSGPLTVVKSLCVTSGVSSAPQFTLVNSTPLSVANAVGKTPTITLLNAPVTVVKAISTQNIEKNECLSNTTNVSTNASSPTIIENRGHNVFVKNTCPDSTVPDMPQSHKILTASNFPQANVLTSVQKKTANGQRNKLKILSSNVPMLPGTSQTVGNVILNKQNNAQRYVPRTKLIGANGTATKYINKTSNNVLKTNVNANVTPIKNLQEKSPQRMVYPTHKSQIKTLTPNFVQKPQGIKTLSPQQKPLLGQVQRSNSGLRTIPPQRAPKIPNKPNYIGKHAVQAQKMRPNHKVKNVKVAPYFHGNHPMPEKQLTFNQALTAEIIETLSNKSTTPNSYSSKHYEILPPRYDNAYTYQDHKPVQEATKPTDDKSKSGLDALSLICQAVLLDHNYNATLPPDSPTRPVPPPISQSQVNGMSGNSMYSPNSGKRRSLTSSNTISSTSSLSNISIGPSNSNTMLNVADDDDATSDVSDVSDRKHDTEGEETDTAPEAEAVTNEEQFEHYGDYVTRCICGFLHDDGYMVECDRCKVWQHVQCVVKNKQVPDEYLCEVCDPSKHVDKQKARIIQQQWLRDRQLLADAKLKKEIKLKETFKQREVISDTDSSDGDNAHNNNVVAKRTLNNRRKSESKQQPNSSRTRRDSAKEVAQRRQKRRERKIVKRKIKPIKHQSDDENHDNWSNHLPQLRQWIEKYEEAVTNHYSPELRARISNIRVNGAQSDLPMQFDCTVQKCRVHNQPLTELKYLVSTVQLSPNTPIIELRGKYMLSTQHRNAGGSLTTRQHSQRPGPFLFFYRLLRDNTEVCVDTRTYGNSARFIRRSCKPNAELRHCIEKGVLHLYIVSISDIEKNCELTIRHESHDLAVIGTTQIACACGNADECAVNKTTIKKNGETNADVHRKRRGRRTTSVCVTSEPEVKPKEETAPVPIPQNVEAVKEETVPVKEEIKEEIKIEEEEEEELEIKEEELVEVKEEIHVKKELKSEVEDKTPVKVEEKEEEIKSPPLTPIMTRRSSHYKSDKEDSRDGHEQSTDKKEEKSKSKKLSREERKLEAILRAIEQMEKADQRKQEHQAKAQHRRESEPCPNQKEEEKLEPRIKRRRRKGRARTTSTHTQNTRRNRLNSTDSYMTSGDETMLSPNDNACSRPSLKDLKSEPNDKDAGLLLALANGDNMNKNMKSPARDVDSNSNSTHSSPETQLSSACLLVQAACEPLESGFKFPKTKKGLMNEWLNKVPEPVQSASSISPSSLTPHVTTGTDFENSGFYSPAKNLVALAQAASYCDTNVHPRGNAKKRWLRQAISEDHSCDSPQSRPDSPPLSEMVAPPKKRRLPRESLSNETSPPLTPTSIIPPNVSKLENSKSNQEGCVEIVYSGTEGDSPTQTLECDAVLKERAAQMKQEFNKCVVPPCQNIPPQTEISPICLLDPRLARDTHHHHLFSNSDHLVGTVEKTLSILGFEDRKPEAITPAKRKLSITEYRQRKKLNNNEKNDEAEPEPEQISNEENNSSESFRATRQRSGSTSSSTSITSSDDEIHTSDMLQGKALSAFNSEPTELERQRETSSLRLKKAFGLVVDEDHRKPALNVEAILNCELPPLKTSKPPPSPTFPIPGSCEVTRDVPSPKSLPPSPPPYTPPPPPPPDDNLPVVSNVENEEVAKSVIHQQVLECKSKLVEKGIQPNMFYTPDEEEEDTKQANTVYDPSGRFVPAFNNPAYSNNKLHISSIDDEARYEGRNPSPPPDLEAGCD